MTIRYPIPAVIILTVVAWACPGAHAQTRIDLRTQGKSVDFSAAGSTKPMKTGVVLPATCSSGETFFNLNGAAGQNLYACVSGAWVAAGAANFSQLGGVAAVAQGGTGAATTALARTNLGAAAAVHTHVLTDIFGILGKQGSAGVLQAFGGGTAAVGTCAQFDAGGNLISSGAPCGGDANSLGGNPLEAGTAVGAGQFYAWDPAAGRLALYSWGSLLAVTDRTINVSTDTVPMYEAGPGLPASCSQYGLLHFQTDRGAGQKLFYCNGATYEPAGGGLADPGSSGLVKRTVSGVTVAAQAGTDYYAPGTAIQSADLPNPTAGAGGKVRATACANGAFVNAINGDSTVGCSTATTPADVVRSGQPSTYTAGARQSFTASATTAGANLACGPLPTLPATGDVACDSNAGNIFKQWNGSAWLSMGFTGTGLADSGGTGILVETAPGSTAARTLSGTANRVVVTNGSGVVGNPAIDLAANPSLGTGAITNTYTNDTAAGTVTNYLAVLLGSGRKAVAAGAATSGILGICLAGCANSGSAEIAIRGRAACAFDNAVTEGDYVQADGVAGKCHDAGASYPGSGGAVVAQVLETGAAGTHEVRLGVNPPAAGGGTGGSVTAGYNMSTMRGAGVIDFNPFDFGVGGPYREDFLCNNVTSGAIGQYRWYAVAASGGSVTCAFGGNWGGIVGHPGILQLATGATSGASEYVTLEGGSYQDVIPDASTDTNWESQWIVQTPTALTSDLVRVGLQWGNVGTTDGSQYAMHMEFDPTGSRANCNSTNWCYVICMASSCVGADSGVAATTADWYKLRIRSTSVGVVLFSLSVNGGAFGAEVPGGSGQTINKALSAVGMTPWAYIKTTSAADRRLYLDAWAARFTGLSR